MLDLPQSVALVTGGAQGIGRTFAEYLLAEGAKVVIGDLPGPWSSNTLAVLTKNYPKNIIFVPCDVTDPKMFEEAISVTIGTFGRLNILINNAGLCNEAEEMWRTMIKTNIEGVVTGTKLGFKYMGKDNGGDGGTIINVSSITALSPWDPVPVYAATKAFVHQLSMCYGQPTHYTPSGVKVISLMPGITDTAMLKKISLSEVMMERLSTLDSRNPVQKAQNLGHGLIHILINGKNGSTWVVEKDEPAREVNVP